MKKLYFSLIATLIALGIAGCEEDELVGSGTIVPTIRIIASNVIFEAQQGDGTIEFEADGAVSVKCDKAWCSTELQGQKVHVHVTDNENIMGRTAVVELLCNGNSQNVIVQQRGLLFKFANGESELVAWQGAEIEIPGSSSFDVKFETKDAWITPRNNGNGGIVVGVAENDLPDERTATLGISLGNSTATYSIRQAGWPFEMESGSVNVGYKQGATELEGTCAKQPTFSADVDWLSATWSKGIVTLSYEANPYVKTRSGKLTVSAGSKSAVIEVTQGFELNFAGTYDMSFFTNKEESATSTPEVTVTQDPDDANLYHLTGIKEGADWDIPMIYEASSDRLKIANASVIGRVGEQYAVALINYIKGTSTYVSYNTTDTYALYFSYTIDESGKIALQHVDTGEAIGEDREVVGLNIYSFNSIEPINKDTRDKSVLLVRRPQLKQK